MTRYLLALIPVVAAAASPSVTISNRTGNTPWSCQTLAGVVVSSHAQQYKAEEACVNAAFATGAPHKAVGRCELEVSAIVTTPAPPPPPVLGTAQLTWTAPTSNTDGTPVVGVLTYRVYHGLSAAAMTDMVPVTGLTYTYGNLAAGTHYFAVSAVNAEGFESPKSSVRSKVVQ